MRSNKQFTFSKNHIGRRRSAHGGSIPGAQKTKRPLGVRSTTHLVLKSSKAKSQWSFQKFEVEIHHILKRFAQKHHIQVLSVANVGNHLHLHLRIRHRDLYKAFIRAVSSAIMMKVTGFSRWNPSPEGFQFWDLRPYTRIISSWKEFLNLKSYIEINQWEGMGYSKGIARYLHSIGVLDRNTS